MAGFMARLKHAWNAFTGQERRTYEPPTPISSYRPGRVHSSFGVDRSILTTVVTKMAVDVADAEYRHVKLDDDGRYLSDVKDGLQECLLVYPNLDQGPRQFRQDIARTLFDSGVAVVVPVDTDLDPAKSASFDIRELRVGRAVDWAAAHVKVSLYNQQNGQHEELWFSKKWVCVIENPHYDIMNSPNATLARLIRKLALLDTLDQQAGSNKLDLIIQLPYVVKSETRREQAKQRVGEIQDQLQNSQYGIAYTDGTEKITQLNRAVENNLLPQIQYLTNQLYDHLGITEEVLKGTASEEVMINYHNRTIAPVNQAVAEEFRRKFLTKTARTQGHDILYFRDVFKYATLAQIAEVADVLTRNEIASSNEIRTKGLGWKPSSDPKADELRNSNMPHEEEDIVTDKEDLESEMVDDEADIDYDEFDTEDDSDVSDEDFESILDDLERDLMAILTSDEEDEEDAS